jgi:hypothetical protein
LAGVNIDFTGDEARAFRALVRAEGKVKDLQDRLRQSNQEARRGGQAFDKVGDSVHRAFDPRALARFVSILAPGGVLLAGVTLLRNELENIRDLQRAALDTQLPLERAQANLIRNLGPASQQQVSRTLASGRAIAVESRVPEATVFEAFASAVSAAGGDVDVATAAVSEAAKLFAETPGQIAEFAGSLIDLAKVTGSQLAPVNSGLLAQVGALSRVVDPRQQARSIAPALIGAREFGASPEAAGALFAAISTGSADVEGRQSATATISFTRQLQDFFYGVGAFKGEKLPKFPLPGLRGPIVDRRGLIGGPRISASDAEERIAFLQDSPFYRERFLDKVSLEQKAIGPITALLSRPDSDIAQGFRGGLATLRATDFADVAASIQGNLATAPFRAVGDTQRFLTSFTEQQLRQDPNAAISAVIREQLPKTLQSLGFSKLGQQVAGLEFDVSGGLAGEDPLGAAGGLIQRRIAGIRRRAARGPVIGSRLNAVSQARGLTDEETSQIGLLNQLLEELRLLNGQFGKVEANTRNTAERSGGGPAAVPRNSGGR